MAKKMKIGVVGCGAIAQQGHLPFYDRLRQAELVVADPSAERLAEVGQTFGGIKRTYRDYREMLHEEKLDALSVCAPNHLHAPVAIAAAERGIDVLCEKPMALNPKDAQRMIAASRGNSTLLMINFTHRFFDGTRKLKQLLDQGKVGQPHTIRVRYVHNGPYAGWAKSDWFYKADQSGGGVLMDMGVHAIDICQYLIGPIRRVSASLANLTKDIPVEDSACLLAELEGGCRAQIEVGWTGGSGFSGIEICGSKGGVVMDFRKGLFLSCGQSRADGSIAFKERPIACDVLGGGWSTGIKTFLNHVKQKTEPTSNGAAGLAAMTALLAAYQAARTGRWVTIKANGIHD